MWVDDFFVVCNVVLVVVNVDWNFVLDVDEWIEVGMDELCDVCIFGLLLGVVCICSGFEVLGKVE